MTNTKSSIINLAEYGIDPASIAGFLNERLYSDCHSKLLYNVNGKKAMAVSVEREFQPEIEASAATLFTSCSVRFKKESWPRLTLF